MRRSHSVMRHLLPVISVAAILLLTACGPGNADATPTLSVNAIYTAAAQTFAAQQATQAALTPPTPKPKPRPSPTLAPPPTLGTPLSLASPTTSIGGKACDSSVFVQDVTVPDGTVIEPGKNFVKTWKLMNNGTCDWTTAYKWSFVSGDAMGGSSVPVPAVVPSGQQVDISVSLVAPTNTGEYKGIWRLQNAQGQPFGDQPWVLIKVGTGTIGTPATPSGSETPTTGATSAPTETISPTP